MRISCDSCNAAEAVLVCLPDNIPLCGSCSSTQCAPDGKTVQKVALDHPKKPHMCDICQDAPAYCICIDERAVLCRECDLSIHKSNKFTESHARYLFVGIKLGLEDISKAYSNGNGNSNAASPVPSPVANGKRKASAMAGGSNGKQPAINRPQMCPVPPPTNCNGHASTSSAEASSSMGYQQPNEMDMTMMGTTSQGFETNPFSTAADFLGVPTLSENFSIKDVDAAYMADEFGAYAPIGVSEDVSQLLEVPDLDFSDMGHSIVGGESGGFNNSTGGNGVCSHWMDDGVVPDITYP